MDPNNDEKQLFVVSIEGASKTKVIVWALGRDDAGRQAEHGLLRGYGRTADEFEITPITNPGDRVKFQITLNS